MTTQLRNRYAFLRAQGEAATRALSLARSEELLDRAQSEGVATVEWLDDDFPYEHGFYSDDEIRAKFASNEWTGPYYCVVTAGDAVASLGGIVVGPRNLNDPYCRVVEAELAAEIETDLRETLSDALDSRTLCPAL